MEQYNLATTAINVQIMILRIPLRKNTVYAPTLTSDDNTKDLFYNTLHRGISRIKMAGILFQNIAVPNEQRQPRNYCLNENRLDLTDEQLCDRYRFGGVSINYLLDIFGDELRRKTNRSHALKPIDQLLIALRFYASGSFLQVIGDTIGVDKSTVSRVVYNVSSVLASKQGQFIKWPTEPADTNASKNSFYRRGRFPGVIGCIDGTHIRILAPHVDENDFVNRKGFHSINVQGVCNHKVTISSIASLLEKCFFR